MVFSSTIFLFLFLPITLAIYFLLKDQYRNYWLLAVSLIFFSWSQPQYLWIILISIVVNYLAAIFIQFNKIKKVVLFVCVILNIGILIYYKYFDFILGVINDISGKTIDLIGIILPIGISFFTFQGMSYAIDVYRNEVPMQKNPLKVALYIILFPQLIAGPIVRYKDVVKEIDQRTISLDDFTYGIQRFVLGLGKKTIIANSMATTADAIWGRGAGNSTVAVAWLGSIAYTLQIFYDFSGYSDMAIGLGRMFGFHFNENFDLPYISKSITEFWRRWHISLSSWFRDYVYIPLGGNRKRVYLNLAIVFLLTGIWHGASWNFIVWGIWNGIFILAERVLKNKVDKKGTKVTRSMGVLYTLFVVNLGWVLFRAETLSDAVAYITNMFGNGLVSGFTLTYYLSRWTMIVGILGILFASSIPSKIGVYMSNRLDPIIYNMIKYIMTILIFHFSILRVVSGTYNPFIYFQF